MDISILENTSDVISRQAAIDATSEIVFVEYEDGDPRKEESIILQTKAAIRDRIKALPPVQPKRGHWMIEPTEEPEYCKCSECGYVNLIVEVFSLDEYHYCPNCGADMRGNEDGTD